MCWTVLQPLSQAGLLYVGPAAASGARKRQGFSTCVLLMLSGAQHLSAQLSVHPLPHFKEDSSPSLYKLGAVETVTEVVHVLPVAEGGSSLLMWPATDRQDLISSAVELPEDSDWK